MKFQIVILCVFLISLCKCAIEWPVFFEHLGFVHSIHNKWDLTVSVKLHLPSLEARLSKTVHRLRLLDHEYETHDHDFSESSTSKTASDSTTSRNQDLSRIEELHESWSRLNRHLLHRTQNLQRRAEDLRGLGRPSSSKRRKRQDDGGGALGGILKTLFGVAYAQEVTQVASRLDSIDSRLSSDLGGVRSSHSELASRTNQELQKHGEVLGVVEKMTHTLERKVADMETNPILKTELGEIVHSRNEQYQSLQLELDLMEERMAELERVVLSLSAGKLCKDVLPPKQLSQTLHNIERQLPGNYSLLFPADEPLWPYYSVLSASANFDSDLETAVVQLTIPLVDLASILDLHRVHNLPLKVKEGYSVTADIATDYLVTDYTKTYFLELNKEDFQDCQVYHNGVRGQHFYCGLKPMLRGQEARSCVMQLFQGQSDPTWCQSRLRHGLVQPFQRLYNGSWIFSALHEQITVSIACPDGHETMTPLSGFGVIAMAEGCTVTSKDFLYPHTFTGSITLSLNFGDKGWDSAEYLTDVPLNETLFGHNEEFHQQTDGDALEASFNEVDDQAFLPQLIEAVQAEYDDDLEEVTPSETGRSSTTQFTPNNILPTISTEEQNADSYIENNNDINNVDDQEPIVDPTSLVAVEQIPSVDEGVSSLNTPLFSFLTSTPNSVSTESTFSNSVQSAALNVEVPDDIAANKDLTTVKYDLLIKLAEKFKTQKWL